MAGQSSGFVGNIPDYYDQGLGPVLFEDFASDMARRVAQTAPGNPVSPESSTGH